MGRGACGGEWEFTSAIGVNAWVTSRRCCTGDDLFAVRETSDPRIHDIIVLDTFEHNSPSSPISVGVVVTSRAVFANVLRAQEGQQDSVDCSADGTYKLEFGGWTLIDCGTVGVVFEGGKYQRRFYPRAYLFVHTEGGYTFTLLVSAVRKFTQEFYGVDLKVAFGQIQWS